jgi:hypothetical protein
MLALLNYTGRQLQPAYNPEDAIPMSLNFAPNQAIVQGQVVAAFTGVSTSDVQTITVDAVSGTFTLSIKGLDNATYTTAALAFNISTTLLTTAIDALLESAGYHLATVVITGGVGASGGGTPYAITFGGAMANYVLPLMTATATLSGGGATATVVHTTSGVTQGTMTAYNGTKITDPTTGPTITDINTGGAFAGGGTAQVETATAAITTITTAAGVATLLVTAAGMNGSPKTYSVAVAAADTATQVAVKLCSAMNGDTGSGHFNDMFTAANVGAVITVTAKTTAANDSTLAITVTNGTCAGLTTAVSAITTPGDVGVTAEVATMTVVGTIASSYANVIVTAAALVGTPKTYAVPVTAGWTADQLATAIRAALNADSALTTYYTVGGSTSAIILTQRIMTGNDGTLNIAIANGNSAGVTTAATSANTTTGVASSIDYAICYTFVNALGGETLPSPVTLHSLADGKTAFSAAPAEIALPTGAAGINYYVDGMLAAQATTVVACNITNFSASLASIATPRTNTAFAKTDGSQIPVGLAPANFKTDALGRVTYGNVPMLPPFIRKDLSVPVYVLGFFFTQDLTGLDANAVSVLGRLVAGTTSTGVLYLR